MRRAPGRSAATLALFVVVLFVAACTALPPPQEWLRTRPAPGGDRRGAVVGSELRARARAEEPLRRLAWQEAVRRARADNPTLAVVRQRVRRAEARVDEARSLAYPSLDARASWVRFIDAAQFRGRTGTDVTGSETRTRLFTDSGTDIYTAGVDLSYPVFDGGESYFAREAASAALEATRSDVVAATQQLEYLVFSAFIDVLLADGEIRIAEDALRFSEEQERRAGARADVGEGLRVDQLRFASRASNERFALNTARARRLVRLVVLGELLDRTLDDDIELVVPEAELEPPPGDDRVALALARRSELVALRATRRELENVVKQERSAWWPALNVFGSYGVISLDDLALNQDEDELQVGAALAWNLFEGGGTTARTRAALSDFMAVADEQRELERTIEREVRDAEISFALARENIAVSQESVRLADEVLTRVTAQYEAGEAEVLDVTEADLARTTAQLALLRSRVEVFRAQARLRRAVGMELVAPVASAD